MNNIHKERGGVSCGEKRETLTIDNLLKLRSIDANALLTVARSLFDPTTEDGHGNLNLYPLVERQPSAAVMPVVYCRECRFYKPDIDGIYLCEHIKLPLFDPEPDFFCSYGERRDSND